jgi:hypothetical protein
MRALGSKLALPQGVIDFIYVYSKNLKIFFEKTQIARVKILSMKHLPVSVFKVCSN